MSFFKCSDWNRGRWCDVPIYRSLFMSWLRRSLFTLSISGVIIDRGWLPTKHLPLRCLRLVCRGFSFEQFLFLFVSLQAICEFFTRPWLRLDPSARCGRKPSTPIDWKLWREVPAFSPSAQCIASYLTGRRGLTPLSFSSATENMLIGRQMLSSNQIADLSHYFNLRCPWFVPFFYLAGV